MTVHVPDRFKAANAFWIGLAKIGLMPAALLSQARLPVTVYDGKKNLVAAYQRNFEEHLKHSEKYQAKLNP